jgi:hypothetical protein
MKRGKDSMIDMLDLGTPEAAENVVWRTCRPTGAKVADGNVWFSGASVI